MAVERVFSQGCQLLHFTCNHLTPLTLCVHLCLRSWSHLDLLQTSDLVKAIPSGTKWKWHISAEHNDKVTETCND